jgi:hypothetical protein
MNLLPYMEMRARFMLGKDAEEDAIEMYSAVTGRHVEKNERRVEIVMRRSDQTTRRRIPDFFVPGVVIGDVKNVGEQGYSPQMHDDFRIARADRVRWEGDASFITKKTPIFDLVVRAPSHRRQPTTVDADLVKDIREFGGDIYELIEDPGD